MATIADIRKQYPQYSDISDAQLADAFYSKFYADMPKEQFYKSINFTPEVQRGRPTMANDPRILTGNEPRLSNETLFEKAGRFLSTPAPLVTPEQLGGSTLGRVAQGVLDPLLGMGQLAAEAMGNESVSQRIRQNEARYQQARAAAGDEGFDLARIGGNVASPINYVVPMGAAGGLTRSAATGAALAATQPVYGDEFWMDKGVQAAVGGVLGPLAEYGVKGVGKLIDSFKGLTETGRQQALQDWLLKTSGKDKDVIIQALRSAQPIVPGSRPTAMEALANVPEGAPLAAAQQKIGRTPAAAPAVLTREAEQEAARQAQLGTIAGTPEQRAAVEAARQATGETREAALTMADTVKNAFDSITENVMGQARRIVGTRGSEFVSGEGIPVTNLTDLAKETTSNLLKYQRTSLADNGFFPLEVKGVIANIDKAIAGADSDLSKAVLNLAKDKILSKADENGLISSVDLYQNVRKTLNQDIESFLQQAGKPAQGGIPQQAAKAAGNVKSFIDASLNKSSNGLWGKYIDEYASHSQKLDRMAIGEALQNKLGTPLNNKERAASFAQAVEDSASLIKRATGMPRYEKVSQVLTPSETAAVNRVLADLQRLEKGRAMAGSVNAPEYAPKAPLEGTAFLNRAYTVAKEVMQALSRGSKEEFERKFIQLAMDPEAMAALMQAGPITNQRKFVEVLNKRLSPEGQRILIQTVTVGGPSRAAGE